MGTSCRRATAALATLVAATLAGCSGGGADPVAVLQSVTAPGTGSTTWRHDVGALSEVANGDYEKLRGQVAVSRGGPDEHGDVSGTRYATGWSSPVEPATADGVCDDLAAWFAANARRLPGDLDESSGRVPSTRTMHRRCMHAAAVEASEGESISDGFLAYPDSDSGDVRYGMFAEMRTRGTAHRLTAVFAAFETP